MLRKTIVFLSLLGILSTCGHAIPEDVAEAYATLPERIDYNFHVKPILSDRCFACHGPDAENQQADLRLDTPEGAYAALTSGNGVAIDPHSLGNSQLVSRITSDDPELLMPPPESNLSLDAREIAVLTKWIEQGAEYKPHWAFTAPERPDVPEAGAGWAVNPIDNFVAARLDREGIAPSPEAEREYLVRRAYFDLNGLPPTPEEIDRVLADDSEDWYAGMVDDLLDRPAYGERMANYWMDVARFADSEGYLDDFHHAMWPYRDWVIKAYNENLPYDDFVEWQIGGDLLEHPSQEQLVATAFNRNHKQNSEGGIIPEEFRVEYVADRANTVGTAFMGLTVGCARCHDHKYDPFSQKNYFQLFGFFNNTVERGDAIFAYNGVEAGQDVENRLAMNAGPTLQLADAETARIRDGILEMIREKEAEMNELPRPESPSPPTLAELERTVAARTLKHLDFEGQSEFGGQKAITGKVGQGLEIGGGDYVTEGEHLRFERSDPFTVSFWIRADELYEEGHFLYNGHWRIQGYRGWDVVVDSNRVHFRLNHAWPFQSIDVMDDMALRQEEWRHYVWSYDGSSSADGVRIYRNGERIEPKIMRDHLVRSTVPYLDTRATVYAHYYGMTVGGRHYDADFAGGKLDEIRVLEGEAGDLVARYLYAAPLGKFKLGSDRAAFAEFDRLNRDAKAEALRDTLRQLRLREVETIDTVRELMVMGDDTRYRRPTYILERGVYDAHGEEVEPGVPDGMLAWPDSLPKNRLGLAKWLTHPDHPLTARVAVNQLWYVVFGRGIVESVEDFGNQGSLPTHPELLDWLAVEFRESGWDVKHMVRLMANSATYRQSSIVRPELEDVDPDNYLLARSHRFRRSAEMVRDHALAASGLLERKVGGKSVFPYQPPGLWKEANNHGFSPRYEEDVDGGLYRRSLYTFWKRNAPAPAMLVFDASLRSECQVRRQRSSTPLQALVLLNDPQMVEACRVLADDELANHRSEVDAARAVFRRLIGRFPTADEQEIITQYYEDELNYFDDHPLAAQDYLTTGYHDTELVASPARVAAMARVAGAVLNSTESYYRN